MPRPPVKVSPAPKKGPSTLLIGGVVALVVAIIAVAVYIAARPDPVGENVSGGASSPSALPDAGGIRIGDAGEDAPAVHVYQDFQCPWCGLLERTSGPALVDAAEKGDIQLTYTLMSFLDGNLRNDSSVRAANAAMCADDQQQFLPFQETVYANQPEPEGVGWTDEQLVGFAEQAGVDKIDTFQKCMADETHVDYVKDMQTRSNQDGISGSPRVFIDGEELSNEDMNLMMQDPNALTGILAALP